MYCKNCGKPISSIADECPYCKTKVNEDNQTYSSQINNQNQSFWNKSLFNDQNGKPVPIWRTILFLIIAIVCVVLCVSLATDVARNW